MPELEIVPVNYGSDQLNFVTPANQIAAVMIFPEENEKRDNLLNCANLFTFQNLLEANPGMLSIASATQLEMLKYGDRERIRETIEGALADASDMGQMAGSYLIGFWLASNYKGDRATVKRVIDGLKNDLNRITRRNTETSEHTPYIELSFHRFQRVAHFWAAYKIMLGMPEFSGDNNPANEFPCASRHVAAFLGLSEAFLEFGEHFTPVGEGCALLDPQVTWKLNNIIGDHDGPIISIEQTEGIITALDKAVGRPNEFDWAAFDNEVDRQLDHHGGLSYDDPELRTKARFSQIGESVCDHKNARGDQKGIDDFSQTIVPAIKALVGKQPSVDVFDDASDRTEAGAMG